jgi:hypothetical protein
MTIIARFLFLLAAPLAVAHEQCDDVAPGKGLLHVQTEFGDMDVHCGFVMAQADGPVRIDASVPGARVYLAKQLVTGPVPLKAKEIYAIHIESPASPAFVLNWSAGDGLVPVPTEFLYKPTATVGAPCSVV